MNILKTALLGALCIGTQAMAMKTTQVKILDAKEGQTLPKEFGEDTQVSIFGSTPRYSAFRHYMGLFKAQLEELDQA